MTATPPRIARALLWLCLPASERQTIPGDLDEEFSLVILPARGPAAAHRWYLEQVLHSIAPLLAMRLRHADFTRALLAALLTLAAPLVATHALRSFVLSQVPLKTDSTPSTLYLTSLLASVFMTLTVGGSILAALTPRRELRAASSLAFSSSFVALLIFLLDPARYPLWAHVTIQFLAPAAALLGGWLWLRFHRHAIPRLQDSGPRAAVSSHSGELP